MRPCVFTDLACINAIVLSSVNRLPLLRDKFASFTSNRVRVRENDMRLSGLKLIASFFLAAILSVPMWATTPPLPGTLNYVEGQAAIGDRTLTSKSVGTEDLQAGQTLVTQTGKAEVLLTPGVFFRLGDNSAATLVSPSLTDTEVALNQGQAMVEVAEIYKDNLLRVQQNGVTTQLLKDGLYAFDADNGEVQVFKGEALVPDGDRQIKLKQGHELDVKDGAALKTAKFNKKSFEQSDLYRFSALRSQYLAEANVNAVNVYYGGPGWYGPGWYWDPLFTAYTWIPGDGIFYSPFGWGFYSPLWVSYAPYYRPFHGRYGADQTARPYVAGHAAPNANRGNMPLESGFRGPSRAAGGASHFDVMGEGFHGGMSSGGFHAGGFHR